MLLQENYPRLDTKFVYKLTKKQFKTFYKTQRLPRKYNFVAIETQNFTGDLNIKWHFDLVLAPWQGGFLERLVRSVQELPKKDLRNYKIKFEELETILLEIELLINNCPLTHIYTDSTELPLTPSQLVFSKNLNHSSLSE